MFQFKYPSVSLFVAIAMAAMEAAVAGATPVQWAVTSGGNGHYYDFVSTPQTWQLANVAANALTFAGARGHLATVTSPAENDFLASVNSNAGWLGGFQDHASPSYSEPNGGWTWVTGEPWNYTNWFPGMPDNFDNDPQDFLWANAGPNAEWDDIQNTGTRGYFVEYQSVPEPAAATGALLAFGVALFARRRPARPSLHA